jgi:non-lysosomal glucosylceramidase
MGSCTHVWNYEQATPYLFNSLAKTMREVEFGYAMRESGHMGFRTNLPLVESASGINVAAADGQMGTIMKFYREWQLSGDKDFLNKHWPKVKAALSYAWIENGWDGNQDGVMEGVQHNTMDVEYFGPNPQMQLWYLGALRAGEEMAVYLKDAAFAKKCRALFQSGSKWTDENLFNGEY